MISIKLLLLFVNSLVLNIVFVSATINSNMSIEPYES